ncbi:niban-like protein, partial [Kipferlia bialata]|eukprot:g8066.t1
MSLNDMLREKGPAAQQPGMEAAKEMIKDMLGYFTKKYLETFTLNLVAHVKQELQELPPPDYQLLEADPDTEPLMQGWITKQGGTVKNWKKRYALMRPDYSIEYYVDVPAEGKKNKQKGTIYPCGYTLVEEPEHMEEKPLCLCLSHKRRRSYFFAPESEEDKKEWLKVLRVAVDNANPPVEKDPVLNKTFKEAYRYTRWYGRSYGWYRIDCDEGTLLGELINDCVIRDLADDLFRTLPSNPKMRQIAKKKMDDILAKMIISSVDSMFKGLKKQVAELKETLEPNHVAELKETLDLNHVAELKETLEPKMRELMSPIVRDPLKPHLDNFVVPALAKVLKVIVRPVDQAFESFLKEWDKRTEEVVKRVKAEGKDGLHKACHSTGSNYFYWSYWGGLREPCYKLDEMREPVDVLGEIVSHVRSYQFVSAAYSMMKELARKAYFTVEIETMGHLKRGSQINAAVVEAVEETKRRLIHDTQMYMHQYLFD